MGRWRASTWAHSCRRIPHYVLCLLASPFASRLCRARRGHRANMSDPVAFSWFNPATWTGGGQETEEGEAAATWSWFNPLSWFAASPPATPASAETSAQPEAAAAAPAASHGPVAARKPEAKAEKEKPQSPAKPVTQHAQSAPVLHVEAVPGLPKPDVSAFGEGETPAAPSRTPKLAHSTRSRPTLSSRRTPSRRHLRTRKTMATLPTAEAGEAEKTPTRSAPKGGISMLPPGGINLGEVKLKSSPKARSPGGMQMPMFDPSAVKLKKTTPKGEAGPASASSPSTDFRSLLKKTNSTITQQ